MARVRVVMSGVALILAALASTGFEVLPTGPGAGPVPVLGGGLARDCALWRWVASDGVRDDDGRQVAVAAHVQGGGRLLCGLLPGARGTRLHRASRRSPLAALRVMREADGYRVHTGVVEMSVDLSGHVRIGDSVISPLACSDARGTWRIAHRCAVRVTLVYGRPVGAEQLVSRWQVTVYAGASRIDVGLWVEAVQATSLPRGVGVQLRMPLVKWVQVDGTKLPGPGDAARAGREVVVGGERSWAGSGFAGLEGVGYGGTEACILGCVRQTRLAAGEGRVVRAALLPGVNGPAPPAWLAAGRSSETTATGTPLRARPAPARIMNAARRLMDRFLTGDEYGVIRSGAGRGDWRFGPRLVGNGEYDTTLGLALWARRTGSVEAWRLARDLADHLLSWDRDATGTGLFFPHGRGHRSAPVEAGHHWVEGLLLLEQLEPDPLRREKLEATLMAQARTLGAMRLDRQLPRSLGWGLLALSVAARWEGEHQEETLSVLKRWRGYVLAQQTPSGLLALTRVAGTRDVGLENPFVQGGIILPGLVRSLTAAPSSRGRRAVRRMASALASQAPRTDPTGTVLPRRVVLDVRRGTVSGRPGTAPGEHAALFLAGLAAANRRLLATPVCRGLSASIPLSLRCDRKAYIGPELSILLRSLTTLR